MKKSTGIITGLIAVIATATVFLLLTRNFYKFLMCWISFGAILSLEMATIVLFVIAEGNAKRIGAAMVFLVETLAMIVVSILFINLFVFSYLWYLAIFVVLTAIASICVILILQNDAASAYADERKNASRRDIRHFREKVIAMVYSPDGKPFSQSLRMLDDDLRFIDDTVSCELDSEIYTKIEALSKNIAEEGYDVDNAVAELRDIIKQRSFIVRK